MVNRMHTPIHMHLAVNATRRYVAQGGPKPRTRTTKRREG